MSNNINDHIGRATGEQDEGEYVKNPAAVALGSIKSERKANASRLNGLKGGRPKTMFPKSLELIEEAIADAISEQVSHTSKIGETK